MKPATAGLELPSIMRFEHACSWPLQLLLREVVRKVLTNGELLSKVLTEGHLLKVVSVHQVSTCLRVHAIEKCIQAGHLQIIQHRLTRYPCCCLNALILQLKLSSQNERNFGGQRTCFLLPCLSHLP